MSEFFREDEAVDRVRAIVSRPPSGRTEPPRPPGPGIVVDWQTFSLSFDRNESRPSTWRVAHIEFSQV